MSAEDQEIPEEMGSFFDLRTAGYDEYLKDYVFSDTVFQQLYSSVSVPIKKTQEPVRILDLGCGTGAELEFVFNKAPNALITGIDVSNNMLARLREKYSTRMDQIDLSTVSFLTTPLGTRIYDYIISVLAAHHFLRDPKLSLYKSIHAALKPGGIYIEGDSVIPAEMEDQFMADYHEQIALVPPARDGYYHIDIPFSLDSQKALLLYAGFKDFELVWQRDDAEVWGAAVYAVATNGC